MLTEAILCLALNIYHEARGEPKDGQYAVAHVTMVRAKQQEDRVCDVVFAKRQFSWTNNLKADTVDRFIPRDQDSWERAKKVAFEVMYMDAPNPVPKADHFFNPTKVNPSWQRTMVHVATIGNHSFYSK